jgi:hypothetical protein
MDKNTCYVSLYYDINRNNWTTFRRSFDDYLRHFEPFINLFDKDKCGDDIMVIFIDKKCEQNLKDKLTENTRIQLIGIDETFMNELPMWKTIEREREIMNDSSFKIILGKRHIFPEHNYPEYTLINHCKIDLICYLINLNIIEQSYYAWVDFGFFKVQEHIPKNLININNFNLETINYTCINEIDTKDQDVIYTLQNAPEKIGGFFFFGRKDKLLEYQKLYHETLDWFQNELNIADDDQHLALQCYFKRPELFTLHLHYGWHRVFRFFEKL